MHMAPLIAVLTVLGPGWFRGHVHCKFVAQSGTTYVLFEHLQVTQGGNTGLEYGLSVGSIGAQNVLDASLAYLPCGIELSHELGVL